MTCATTIQQYLNERGVPYDTMHHTMTPTSMDTAVACSVLPDRLAKAVVLADDRGSALMAVLPASRQLKINGVCELTGRKLRMVHEWEIASMFGDCAPGAVPPLGVAYGIETVWDDSLGEQSDMYLEAGDHETVLHMQANDFLKMMGPARHGSFSRPM